jgi:hypothetical protein
MYASHEKQHTVRVRVSAAAFFLHSGKCKRQWESMRLLPNCIFFLRKLMMKDAKRPQATFHWSIGRYNSTVLGRGSVLAWRSGSSRTRIAVSARMIWNTNWNVSWNANWKAKPGPTPFRGLWAACVCTHFAGLQSVLDHPEPGTVRLSHATCPGSLSAAPTGWDSPPL